MVRNNLSANANFSDNCLWEALNLTWTLISGNEKWIPCPFLGNPQHFIEFFGFFRRRTAWWRFKIWIIVWKIAWGWFSIHSEVVSRGSTSFSITIVPFLSFNSRAGRPTKLCRRPKRIENGPVPSAKFPDTAYERPWSWLEQKYRTWKIYFRALPWEKHFPQHL